MVALTSLVTFSTVQASISPVKQDTFSPVHFERFYNEAGFPMIQTDSTTFSEVYKAAKLVPGLKHVNDSLISALNRAEVMMGINEQIISDLGQDIKNLSQKNFLLIQKDESYKRELGQQYHIIDNLHTIIKKKNRSSKMIAIAGISGVVIGLVSGALIFLSL